MNRVLEPELMEDEMQVIAYSNADFSSSNNLFVNYIIEQSAKESATVLDLGCGPGDVDVELANKMINLRIWAIDGSLQMCRLAIQKVKLNNLSERIQVINGRLPNLNIETEVFDIIVSKDLLHHIPNPDDFWKTIERFANKSTSVYVMDLLRPDSAEIAKEIVNEVSGDEPEILKMDFYNSLLAAFTLDEIVEQLSNTNFNYTIEKIGQRHFMAKCYLKQI